MIRIFYGIKVVLLSCVFAFPSISHSTIVYSIDSGTSDSALGLSHFPLRESTDFMWLNGFNVIPGGEVIHSIDVAISSICGWGCKKPNPLDIEVYLYNDPTNDMDPTDAVLLTGSNSTIRTDLGDTFIPIMIDPTVVDGTFFVSALLRDVVGNSFPLPTENIGYASQRTWLVRGSDGIYGVIDETDLSGAGTPNGGAWESVALLRATGVASVPEPTSLAIFILGLTGIFYVRTKRANSTLTSII